MKCITKILTTLIIASILLIGGLREMQHGVSRILEGNIENMRSIGDRKFSEITDIESIEQVLNSPQLKIRTEEENNPGNNIERNLSGVGSYGWMGIVLLILLIRFSRRK